MQIQNVSALLAIVIGVAAGLLGGLIGLGGGTIVIPAMVFFLGFSQHLAQGTSLAMMLPPIGILAVLTYAQDGYVDWKIATFLCLGFLAGSYFGASLAVALPEKVMTQIFGIFLVVMGARLLIK